jgi:cell division protease FtsH
VFLGRDFTSTPDYSEEVAASIDAEVRALIEFAHRAANEVLAQNREILDSLAGELVRFETLEADRVQEIFAGVAMWQGDSSGPSGRSGRRPDAASPAPGRSSAAAARQSDAGHRRPGGST